MRLGHVRNDLRAVAAAVVAVAAAIVIGANGVDGALLGASSLLNSVRSLASGCYLQL
jgi:hypothetical protein